MQERKQALRLQAPLHIRLLSFGVTLAGYVAIYLFSPERVLLLGLLIWTAVFMRGIFYSPEIIVHPNGIETQRLGIRHFTHWRDIRTIHIGDYVSQIYPKNIHPWVKYFLYSYLMITFWRSNYKEAMEVVKNNVQQAQEITPQRVYE